MESTKDQIFRRIAAAAMPEHPYPERDFTPERFADPVATFEQRLQAAGGAVATLAPGATLDAVVRRCYPEARSIASTLEELTCATLDPDATDDPRTLVDVDVAVVEGAFGVAENGAVWVPQTIRHKALYFGATALVIVIPRTAIVATMHEAMERWETLEFGFGSFISGPSKTADIEQALVFGAHGAMALTVVLRA